MKNKFAQSSNEDLSDAILSVIYKANLPHWQVKAVEERIKELLKRLKEKENEIHYNRES